MDRLVETKRPQVGAGLAIQFISEELFGENSIGRMFSHVVYEAMLNRGIKARVTLKDPHFTMMGDYIKQYLAKAQTAREPIECKLRLQWMPISDRPLWTNEISLAVSSVDVINETDSDGFAAPDSYITFEAIDFPQYILTGGDAGGYCYEGSITKVIDDVVQKYGSTIISTDIRVKTKDNEHNQWWQYRMSPIAFISSLLSWSPPLANNARWIIYPDYCTLVVTDQISMKPLHRSMYYWGGHGEVSAQGDIMSYKVLYDGSIYQRSAACVTSGMSAVSGAYYDRISDKDKEYVFANDTVAAKLKPITKIENSFTKGPTDDPLTALIGWSTAIAIPEFSAGDIGMPYRDYMRGYAEQLWIRGNERMTVIELVVTGHHIWAEPEGLGVDTINIVMQTALSTPHYLNGNWIVYGFRHDVTIGSWYTTLWCYRLQHDAEGTEVGA